MRKSQWMWWWAAAIVVVGVVAFWIFDPVTRASRETPEPEPEKRASPAPETHASPPAPASQEAARPDVERTTLELEGVSGLSGLAVDPAGVLWAVPERSRVLVRIEGARASTIPLEGVPDGTDTESMAFVDATHVAFGTETQVEGRAADFVLIAEIAEGRAHVAESIELPYSTLGIPAVKNRGIEGLCIAGGTMVVTLETVDDSEGLRRAVVATRPVSGGEWTVARVRLTTATGKPSALDCRARGSELDVIAIERHWEVMRVIAFTLDMTNAGAETTATLWEDLAGRIGMVNLEGVVASSGQAVLVVDNDSGGVQGPNEVIHLRRAPFGG